MRRTAVFIRMASRPVPRVQRVMQVAKELGYEPIFCGALREDGLNRLDSWAGFPVVRVGRKFPLLNGKRIFLYLSSVLQFQLSVARFLVETRPQVIHASDIETMPASILYSKLARIKLIYNVHDNLSQRYNLPNWIQKLLNFFEGLMVLLANETLVPEVFRRDALPVWCRQKVRVIRNTPSSVSYVEPTQLRDGKIRLFYGGWLDWGRGLMEMVELAEAVPQVELRVAGEGSTEIVDFLKKHPRVTFLGFLEHKQTIKETEQCDFVPAFYRPSTVINRYAASNKLAEALAIGRPLLLNDEMKILETLGKSRAVLSRKFDEISKISSDMLALHSDKDAYLNACKEARSLYEKFYLWETAHAEMRKVFASE